MIATLAQGTTNVVWNDNGDPIMIRIGNLEYMHQELKDVMDLYQILEFLFRKPS